MKKAIQWEKWADPMRGQNEFVPEMVGDQDWSPESSTPVEVRPVIPTAGGMLPVTVYGSFSRNFAFRMMHTNFNISSAVIDIIRHVPGVETLDVVTRYRARVGFGKCFPEDEVCRAIEVSLGVGVADEDGGQGGPRIVLDAKTADIVSMLREMGSESRWWAIYVVPNGKIDFQRAADAAKHEQVVELYRQSQQLAGGVVFTSDDARSTTAG